MNEITSKVNENKKTISFRLSPTDFDSFKLLCINEKMGQSEMFSKLINNYLHKDEAKILEQSSNLTIPIKFIAKYENRILKSKPKISYMEFSGKYLYSDFPIRQPVEAFLFADLLRSNYGVENPTEYIITHAVALAKITSLDDEPCNKYFLGESIKLVKKNTCACAVRNDWYHILDTADEVWAKLSNYNDEYQKDQIAYLLFDKGDGEPYDNSFVPQHPGRRYQVVKVPQCQQIF